MNVGNSGGSPAANPVDPRWEAIGSATWSDFFNACQHVLLQLPRGHALLLQPALDGRVLRLRSRTVLAQVLLRGDVVATPPADDFDDLVQVVRRSVNEHWKLRHPRELTYAFEGAASNALVLCLRSARVPPPSDHLLAKYLPLPSRRKPTRAPSSRDGTSITRPPTTESVRDRLDDELIERLRSMGREE